MCVYWQSHDFIALNALNALEKQGENWDQELGKSVLK